MISWTVTLGYPSPRHPLLYRKMLSLAMRVSLGVRIAYTRRPRATA
jgi:hypothetical protein